VILSSCTTWQRVKPKRLKAFSVTWLLFVSKSALWFDDYHSNYM
jgi:hypothetical protein